jgi:predicted transcriptional regulator
MKRQATTIPPFPKPSEDSVSSYGLTAVTLGEVLKDQLDEAVAATNENRSAIVRQALERYFDELPELRKRRKENRERARDFAFPRVFGRLLDEFNSVLREFAYPHSLPIPARLYSDLQLALDKSRDWLTSQIPDEFDYSPPRELALALSDIHRGFYRLFREAEGKEWQREAIERWRKKLESEKGKKVAPPEK